MTMAAAQEVELGQFFSLAIDLHTQGQFEQAARLYERILTGFPDNPDALHLLGLSHLHRNDSAEAIKLIEKAIQLNHSSPEYFMHLAAAFQAAGRIGDIIPTLQAGLAVAPNHPGLLESLANQILMHGDSHQALALLNKAWRQTPDDPGLNLSLARVHARRGDVQAALAALRQALNAGAIDVDVYLDVAEGLAAVGYTDQSRALLETAIAAAPLDDRPCRQLAELMHKAGQYDDALIVLLQGIARQGETLPLLIDLGSAYLQRGLLASAIGTYKDALRQAPNDTGILSSLAFALLMLGHFAEAERICTCLVELIPNDHNPHLFLGQLYQEQNKYDAALKSLYRAQYLLNARILDFDGKGRPVDDLTIQDMNLRLDCLSSLSTVTCQILVNQVKNNHLSETVNTVDECSVILHATAEWVGLLSKRISLTNAKMANDLAESLIFRRKQLGHALYDQGLILSQKDNRVATLHVLKTAVEFSDDDPAILCGIANLLMGLSETEEAAKLFQRMLELDPDNASAFNGLGLTCLIGHHPKQAVEWLEKAYALSPAEPPIRIHLAWAKQENGQLSEAQKLLEDVIADYPEIHSAWGNLGIVSQEMGNFEKAIECNRKLLSLNPQASGSHSAFLFGFQYVPYITVDDIKTEIMAWGKRHAAPHYRKARPLTNDPDPERKIRVGFVSADMKGHSATYFTGNLFKNFDRSQFEIYAYAHVAVPDPWTDFFRSLSDRFYLTPSYSDDQLADLIRRDRIDVLIDLSGHTSGCRLLVFAQRPAPVQVSWIGIGNTTGVLTMDYFLTDWSFVPKGYEHLFCEKVWRLPSNLYCYEALNAMPEPAPLPALRNGYLTFGSFSRAVRFNQDVRKAWAALLAATPNSRLFLNTRAFTDDLYREQMFRDFENYGIDRSRLRLDYITPTLASWAAYSEVDIALDPFPHNAGLTTCEALWMGVPVLTVLDRPPQGRYGASILTAAGLPEFIAQDCQDLIHIGSNWADRIDALADMRAGLREKVRQSRLCDGVAYTRDFENALRGMWREWCQNPVFSIPDESKQ